MVHSPKVVVKRTVSVDMMLEDESLPFLLVDAGRTAGIHQQKRKTLVFQHHVNGNSTFDNHFRGMDHPM